MEGNRIASPVTSTQEGYAFVHFEDTKAGMIAGITAASEERGNKTTSLKCELSRNLMKQLNVNGILPPTNSTARVITPTPSNADLNRSNKSSWSTVSGHNSPARKKPFSTSSFAKHNEPYFQPVQFDVAPDQMFAMDFCPVPASGSEIEAWPQMQQQQQQHAPYYYFMGYTSIEPQGVNGQGSYIQQYPAYPHPPAAYYPYPAHMMNTPPMAMQQQMAYAPPGCSQPPHLSQYLPHHQPQYLPHPQPQYHPLPQPYEFQQQQQQQQQMHMPCYYDGSDSDSISMCSNSDCDSFQPPVMFVSHSLGPYITVPALHMNQRMVGGMSPPFPMVGLVQQQESEEEQQQQQPQEEEGSECSSGMFPISPWLPTQESLCISPIANDDEI